ncbi:MAG: AraC family transcriptional regulator, partial [Burkholderiales bacterium]|nr:AraC family transcriptional regulator [Phycisphaerae bacterium]
MSKVDLSPLSSDTQSREPEFYSLQISEAKRFHFSPVSGNPGLTVIGGGVERCATDYHVQRSGFPYLGIEFVARGAGKLRLGRRNHRLIPGQLFCYDASVPHDIRSDKDDPLVKYFVDVSGSEVASLLKIAGLRPGEVLYTVSPQAILSIFDELIRSGLDEAPHARQACGALFQVLAYRIADTRVATPTKATPAFDTYLRCRRELYRSAVSLHSVQALAERCGLDEAYLSRIFRRFDSTSPYQLLRRLKMEYAARRLAEPGVLVKQVAAETGFTDPFTFSRSFRATIGRPPSAI